MSRLEKLDIGSFIEQYELTAFVETGLWRGYGLAHAMTFPFSKLFSIEINSQSIRWNRSKTKDSRVTLLLGSSIDMLPTAIDAVEDLRVLWWLDAHFQYPPGKSLPHNPDAPFEGECLEPRTDTVESVLPDPRSQAATLDHSPQRRWPLNMIFPLQTELETIRRLRNCERDVFLIDDLWMYNSARSKEKWGDPGDLNFLEDLLGSTHDFSNRKHVCRATPKSKL
jgi:hypothetical protein